MPAPRAAPFQVKITYRLPDGSVCMRILTQTRPVTESRELAESEINLAVVGEYRGSPGALLLKSMEIVVHSKKSLFQQKFQNK